MTNFAISSLIPWTSELELRGLSSSLLLLRDDAGNLTMPLSMIDVFKEGDVITGGFPDEDGGVLGR